MNLSDEITSIVKEQAKRRNKESFWAFTYLLCLVSLLIFVCIIYNNFIIVFFLLLSTLVLAKCHLASRIPLDEESLKNCLMSLQRNSSLNREIEMLVNKKQNGEKEIFYLNDYEIVDKGNKRYLKFMYNGKKISFPIDEVKYDKGEKRVEFYISDRDWTVNIQKGSWLGVQIYNL